MELRATYANGEECWHMMDYPTIQEETGELGVLEFGKEFGFVVKRVFYLRGIKEKANRGMHSHKELNQLIICLNGGFTIELDNGREKLSKNMRMGNQCLYIDGRVWRNMMNFSEDAVVLVLCDREYIYDEVVRDYAKFLKNLEAVNNVL